MTRVSILKKRINPFVVGACVAMFSGFVLAVPAKQATAKIKFDVTQDEIVPVKTIEEKTQAVYRLLLAEVGVNKGLSDLASPLFLSLAREWDDAYLLEKGTDAALSVPDYDATYRLAERWAHLDTSSSRAREMYAIAAWLTDSADTENLLKEALRQSSEPDVLMNQWIKGMSKLAAGVNGVKKNPLDTLDSRYELLSRVAGVLTTQSLQSLSATNTKPNKKQKNTKLVITPNKSTIEQAIYASGKVQLSLAVFAFQLQRFDEAKSHALRAWQQSKQDDILAKDIGTLLSKESKTQNDFWVTYLKSNPNSILARCMLGLSSVDARDRLEAQRLLAPLAGLLERSSSEKPELQQALGTLPDFTLAVYFNLQNRHEAARAYFNDYLTEIEKQNKKDPAIIERIVYAKLGLLRGYLVQKKASAALDIFNQISMIKPDVTVQPSIEKLKLLALTEGVVPALKQIKQWEGGGDQSVAELKVSGATPNKGTINNTIARRMTLELYHYLDTTDLAVDTINYWLGQESNQLDEEILLTRELAYFKDKQLKSSEAVYLLNQLHLKYPDNQDIWNDLAYLLVNHSLDLSRAAKLTNKAYKADSGNPAIIDTLGWLNYRQGDRRSALEKVQLSYDLIFDAEVATHLYELLLANKQFTKAQQVFDELLKERPDQLYRLEAIDLQTKTTQQIKTSKKAFAKRLKTQKSTKNKAK